MDFKCCIVEIQKDIRGGNENESINRKKPIR